MLESILSFMKKRPRCPSCARPYDKKDLVFRRFLSRKEAELLEKSVHLKSHFVYACPHCGGDILDT